MLRHGPFAVVACMILIMSCASTKRTSDISSRGLISIVTDAKDVTFTETSDRRAPFEKGTDGNIAYVSHVITDTFEVLCDIKDGRLPLEQFDQLPPNQRAVIRAWLSRGVMFDTDRESVLLRCMPTEIHAADSCVTTLRTRATKWQIPWQLVSNLSIEEQVTDDTVVYTPFDANELQKYVVYPESMRIRSLTSKTVTKVLIDECGEIEQYQLDSTQRVEFQNAALQAILATKFAAPVYRGRSSRLWISIPISFRLR